MEHISRRAAGKLLSIHKATVQALISQGLLRSIDYGNGSIYVLKSDVEEFKMKIDTIRSDYFTANEAAQLLELSRGSIRNLILSKKFTDTKKLMNTIYISKSEVTAFKNGKDRIENTGLISIYKAAKLLSMNIKTFDDLCTKGTFEIFLNNKGNRAVLIDEVFKIKKELEKYYSVSETAKIINIGEEKIYEYIKAGKLKNAIVFINKWLIPKSEVKSFIKNREELEKNYFSFKEAMALIRKSSQNLKKLITDKDLFPNTFYKNKKWYIFNEDIERYLKSVNDYNPDDYYTSREASNVLGIKAESLRTIMMQTNWFKNSIRGPKKNEWLYKKADINEYLEHKQLLQDKKCYRFISDIDEAEKYFLEECGKLQMSNFFPKTDQLFKSFFDSTIKSSKARNLRTVIYRLLPAYKFLSNYLSKEVYLYLDAEIKLLLKTEDLAPSTAIIIGSFLNYLKSELKSECRFKKQFKRVCKYNPKIEREIYSENVFLSYYRYVTELNYHTKLAIENSIHAQLWIYVMVHFFEAWRAGDIVDIPSVDLSQASVSNFEWFNNHTLTLTQAQVVLNQYYVNEFYINKTGAINGFDVPNSMILPMGTALVIAELHRRNNNKDYIMYHFRNGLPSNERLYKFFKGNKVFVGFSNLKACRTLLTLFYEYLSEKSDRPDLAYAICRKLRGHKYRIKRFNKSSFQNTTAIYIQEMNNYKKPNNVSKCLFETKSFGWLYYIMLKIVDSEKQFEKLSLEDKTNIIVSMQDKQSPLQVEGISKLLLTQQQKKISLINEILNMPKRNLQMKLKKIFSGLMPSNMPESQCFKYGSCPYESPSRYCIKCIYFIPGKYFLITLKREIYDLINAVNKLDKDRITERKRIKSKLDACLQLLCEALSDRYGLGENIVNAFIDREDLYKKLCDI